MGDLVLARVGGSPTPDEWKMYRDMAGMFCKTEFVPKGLRARPDAVLACMVAGHELGIGPMQALKHIAIVDGKPAPSAELMVSLVRRDGHSIKKVELSAVKAVVAGTRKDTDDSMVIEFTMAMAQRAGLGGKSNWKSYPEAMLWARAVSQLCRMLFPDSIAGMGHTPDELGAITNEDGLIIEAESVEIQPQALPVADTPEVDPPDAPTTPLSKDTGGVDAQPADEKQLKRLVIIAQELGWDDDKRHSVAGVQSFKDLTHDQAKALTSDWTKLVNAERREKAKASKPVEVLKPPAEPEPFSCWAMQGGRRCRNEDGHDDSGHDFSKPEELAQETLTPPP